MEILRCLMPQLIRRGELQESPAGFGLAHRTRNAHMVRPTDRRSVPPGRAGLGSCKWGTCEDSHVGSLEVMRVGRGKILW